MVAAAMPEHKQRYMLILQITELSLFNKIQVCPEILVKKNQTVQWLIYLEEIDRRISLIVH